MKQLVINFDDKIADRIESTSNRLQISPDSFCLHAICEKLEEATDFKSPVMLVDVEALRTKIQSLENLSSYSPEKPFMHIFKRGNDVSIEWFESAQPQLQIKHYTVGAGAFKVAAIVDVGKIIKEAENTRGK